MKDHTLDRFLLYGSLGCFALTAGSLSLMGPYADAIPGKTTLAGLLFWIPMLLAAAGQILLSIRSKRWYRTQKRRPRRRRIGMLCFCSNRIGTIFDLFFLLSGLVFVASLAITEKSGFFSYISLSFFVFFFASHCIFNGNSYNYIIRSMWVEPKYLRQKGAGIRRKSNDEEQNVNL